MHSWSSYYSFSAETADVFIGITLNTLLLYLIKRYSNTNIGNYKYLLAVFALFDIFLCSIHGLLNPVVFLVKNTFAAALYAPWQSHELISAHLSFFTVPFALMNIHFLYRYWSVSNPTRVALFSKRRFVALLTLYPIAEFIAWFILAMAIKVDSDDICLVEIKAALLASHNGTIEEGWLAMDHWRDGQLNVHVLYVIVFTMIIIFGSFSSASTLAALTYWHILQATTLSQKHRTLQFTLLVAVCAQTFVPLICVYIPYFMCLASPFLSLSGKFLYCYGMIDHFSLLLSIFPGWDAIVIILLIKDYRIGFLKMLGLWREKSILVRNTQFTSAVLSSIHPVVRR